MGFAYEAGGAPVSMSAVQAHHDQMDMAKRQLQRFPMPQPLQQPPPQPPDHPYAQTSPSSCRSWTRRHVIRMAEAWAQRTFADITVRR